jgi:hypothetical protein
VRFSVDVGEPTLSEFRVFLDSCTVASSPIGVWRNNPPKEVSGETIPQKRYGIDIYEEQLTAKCLPQLGGGAA